MPNPTVWLPLTVDAAISLLNEILEIDPQALSQLIEHRVPCNAELGDHPTVQVTGYKSLETLTVGLLGILNGLFGVDEEGWGAIAARYEDDDLTRVVEFIRSDKARSLLSGLD